jgi:hydrogenase maturation protease
MEADEDARASTGRKRARVNGQPKESPAARRVAVLGVGNTLMGDDGVGVEVARLLSQAGGLPPGCEIVLGETAGMGLVRHFRECDAVVFVDAIDAGDEPGTVYVFHPDEAGVTALRSNNIHGMGVGYLLTCARMAGADPDVVCVAVQVGDVRPAPDALSTEVAAVVHRVAAIAREQATRMAQG